MIGEFNFQNTMNEVQIFSSPEFGEIRVVQFNNEPYFVASDVAKTLGYAIPQKAVLAHCKHCSKMEHPSNKGTILNIIPESDLYRLVMKSKMPQAEQFQDWVCMQVLPSIRKHGAYMTPEKIEEVLLNPDTLIKLATNLKQEQQRRIIAECKVTFLEEVTIENAPKVLFATAVEGSDHSCLVGELAKVLCQNGIEIGQNRLFEWLRENNYLCTKGESHNIPTQKAMEMGLFELKKRTVNKPDGTSIVTTTPKITGRGQIYFVNKFLDRK